MSQEYILSLALVLGSILKAFGFELDNKSIEALVVGVVALYVAFRRYKKGDINLVGAKV